MVPIAISYLGDLRCQAVHGPSGSTLVTDAPVDNQGKGETFSPTDLIATGLATCILTTMGIIAKRDGLDLSGSTVQVEKHMSTAAPRRIVRLVTAFHLPARLPVERRASLENAARACPVARSLHPDVSVDVSFTYDR